MSFLFGIHNYNKHLHQYRTDLCENCGKPGHLHSYTYTAAVHFLRLPLFPIGGKRVVDECRSCKASQEVSVGQWKHIRRTAIPEVLEKVRTNPDDRDAAKECLELISRFGSPLEFEQATGLLLPHYREDPEIMDRIGTGMIRYQHYDQGRMIEQSTPGLGEHSHLSRLVGSLTPGQESHFFPVPSSGLGILPFFVFPSVVTILFFLLVLILVMEGPSPIYLVNGLSEDYTVDINGVETTLLADDVKRVRVEKGPLLISAVEGQAYSFDFVPIEKPVAEGKNSRMDRWGLKVFNPDRTAVLAREEVIYSVTANAKSGNPSQEEGEYQLFAGKSMYELPYTEYVFKEAPDTISTSMNRVSKNQLTHIVDPEPVEVVEALHGLGKPDWAPDYIRAKLDVEPHRDTEEMLSLLQTAVEPEEFIAYLETKLSLRPVLVEFHRQYQDAMKDLRPDHDLLKTYQDWLAKEPDNAELARLAERISGR